MALEEQDALALFKLFMRPTGFEGETPVHALSLVFLCTSASLEVEAVLVVVKYRVTYILAWISLQVGEDTDPRPWTSFDGMLTSVRQVNDG